MRFSDVHEGDRLRWAPERNWLDIGAGAEVLVADARAHNRDGERDRHGRYVLVRAIGPDGKPAAEKGAASINTLRGLWRVTARLIATRQAELAEKARKRDAAEEEASLAAKELREAGVSAMVTSGTFGKPMVAVDVDTARRLARLASTSAALTVTQ